MPKPLKLGGEKTETRIAWVVEQLERTPRDSVVVRAAAREFGVTDRQAREYVRSAYERVRDLRKEVAPFDFDRMEAIKYQVIENALADRERALLCFGEVLSIEASDRAKFLAVAVRAGQVVNAASDQLTRMHGLYTDKVEHSGDLGAAALTPAEREARIKALLAKRKAGGAERG
jgi:hypothetical protein